MTDDIKKEKLRTKIYILVLFFCGVGLWFSLKPVYEQKMRANIAFDKKIVSVFAVVKNNTTDRWHELYRKIKLKSVKTCSFLKRSLDSLRGLGR